MKMALSIIAAIALIAAAAGAYLYLIPAQDDPMAQFSDAKKAAIKARAAKQALDAEREQNLVNALEDAKAAAKAAVEQQSQ